MENGRLWAQRKDRNLRNFSVPATGLFRRFGWATLTGEVRIGAPHDAESHAGGQSAERRRPGAEHDQLADAEAARGPQRGRRRQSAIGVGTFGREAASFTVSRPKVHDGRSVRQPGKGGSLPPVPLGRNKPVAQSGDPPFASLRSRIPRPCAHRSRWRRPRVPSRARLRQGWGAFFPGGGKFPPHLVPPVGAVPVLRRFRRLVRRICLD